jgi:hypothetical protein
MPVLHNDITDSQYTVKNTGIKDYETRLEKWYGDYMQGTIVHYKGAKNRLKGVHADWWQYHPIWI